MKISNEMIIMGVLLLGASIFLYTQYTKKEGYEQSAPSMYNRMNDTPVQAVFRSAQDYANYAVDTGDKLLPLEFARTDFYKDVRKMQAGQSFDELSPTYKGDAFHRSITRSNSGADNINDAKLRADAIDSGNVQLFEELVNTPARHMKSMSAAPTEFDLVRQPSEQGGLYWPGYFDDDIGQ